MVTSLLSQRLVLLSFFLSVALSVVAQTNFECPPADSLSAGDASTGATGLARMRVSPTLARELYQRRERRGGWSPMRSRLRFFLGGEGSGR